MKTTIPMGGGFAGGLASSLSPAIKAFGNLNAIKQQAGAQGALMGAQTAESAEKARGLSMTNNSRENPFALLDDPQIAEHIKSNPTFANALRVGLGLFGATGEGNVAGMLPNLQGGDLTGQGVQAGNAGDLANQNRLVAAAAGKTYEPFKAVGDSGYAMDAGTGSISAANPALTALFGDKAAAEVAYKRGQQGGQNTQYDMNRGVIVDKQTGTARPVTMGNGQPLPYQDKPMPTTALKVQQDHLDAIGTASSINADLGSFAQQLQDGRLDLGLFSNLANKARNNMGMSSEESRNLQSFESTLEKLRNDSLRLNKGVQTDGDAQRAWNELLTNINDPKVVRQRLGEIQKINERAVQLRIAQNENLRSNFGLQPMSYDEYTRVGSAIGGGASVPAAGPARQGGRMAEYQGRKVMIYPDGDYEFME